MFFVYMIILLIKISENSENVSQYEGARRVIFTTLF